MMLEQSLISPNFLGKESFRWFIGVVTQHSRIQDATVGGGYKVKVRIIGHHPDCDEIKDPDLPWAHVLVPLSMGAGNLGNGCYNAPKGGETVIGFFMDGDNGQQPVIIGSLFAGYDIVHTNEYSKGTCGFSPFKTNQTVFNNNNVNNDTGMAKNGQGGVTVPSPTGKVAVGIDTSNGKTKYKDTVGTAAADNQKVVRNVQVCKSGNNIFSQITSALQNLLSTIQQIQSLVNATLDSISNLVQEIADFITDLFYDLIKYIRDEIIKAVYKALSTAIEKILPKDLALFKQIITDQAVDAITCAFYKILQKLAEFILTFLLEIVDKAISIPLCAVETLVGSVVSTVASEIEAAIGPTLDELSSELGSAFGSITGYVSMALSYAQKISNFFTCENKQCKESYDYQVNVGWIPPNFIENYTNIVNYPAKALDNAKTAAEDWLGINNPTTSVEIPAELQGQLGGCDVTSLDCGLPDVTFFGGGGAGAAGLAVVDSLGQLVGIDITDFGSGYTEAPYVSIEDPCNNGGGASATAVIDDAGSVVDVIINEPGAGYLSASDISPGISTTTTTDVTGTTTITKNPCEVNPINSSGSEVIGSITGVTVVKSGVGYTTGDVIIDNACSNAVQLYPTVDNRGRITSVNIINPGKIRVYPRLIINSPNGEGAILRPIIKFDPVKQPTIETNKMKVRKVILCAEDHGR